MGVGMALSWADLNATGHTSQYSWFVFTLSMLFAFVMQIDSNFINDYFDCKKGLDDKALRKGPKRACAEGWITMTAMKKGIAITTILSALIGLPLAFIGGWMMVPVGIACIIGAFLYTTHLSYKGLGDVLCLFFFGIIPVCIPYYIQTGCITISCLCAGISTGIVIDAMMMANNYRDIPSDTLSGKRTLFVRIGKNKARIVFASVAPIAIILLTPLYLQGHRMALALPLLIYMPMHFLAVKRLYNAKELQDIIAVLKISARNIVIYGIATIIGILI